MRVRRYVGRHLSRRPVRRAPVVVGTATAVWLGGPARAAVHEIARHETLAEIAARYGTTVERLASINDLKDPDLIVAGEVLRIPFRATLTRTHLIKPGETLSRIAARYGVPHEALARANHIKDPDLIVAGTEIKVPGATAVSRAGSQRSARGRSPGKGSRASGGGGKNVAVPAPAPTAMIEAALELQAREHVVDVSLVKAVAMLESGWRQDVVSSAGAIGVMQVMPDTADFVNRVLGHGSLDVRLASDNVHLGVAYLEHVLRSQPTLEKGLAAYFAGPANVGKRLSKAQRHYVDNVLAIRGRFR